MNDQFHRRRQSLFNYVAATSHCLTVKSLCLVITGVGGGGCGVVVRVMTTVRNTHIINLP